MVRSTARAVSVGEMSARCVTGYVKVLVLCGAGIIAVRVGVERVYDVVRIPCLLTPPAYLILAHHK